MIHNIKDRQEILLAHYRNLLRKAATWAGLLAVMASMLFVPTASYAGQINTRSATVGSSAAGAVTTYDVSWKPSVTTGIGSIKFQICTSPLELTACSVSNSSTFVGATLSTSAPTTSPFTGWTTGSGGTAATTTSFYAVKASGTDAMVTSTQYVVRINNVTNPNAANTSYYLRVYTYTGNDGSTGQVDFGAVALSTARQISVAANVQESLTFCVGTSGTGCGGGGLTGTSVNLGTGADNVLSASTPSGGTSLMAVDTNATSGYAITYITTSPGGTGGSTCAGSLSSTNDCITDAGGTAGTFTAGTSKFGINLKANTTPCLGANVSGSGSGTASGQYNIADNYAFQAGSTPRTVASASGPTLSNLYTVSYVAQAGNTTKPGAYSATFTWIATGTF